MCNYITDSGLVCKFKSSLIGNCRHCKGDYCNKHRLQEDHLCPELYENSLKERSYLEIRLLKEKQIGSKITKL
jgi:predicted nucleic acid binding AN1-type Zn finger protein